MSDKMKIIVITAVASISLISCSNKNSNKPIDTMKELSSISDTIIDTKKVEYRYIGNDKIYLLDEPNGKKVINKKATDYFGEPYYYQISSLDPLDSIDSNKDWILVEHSSYEQNRGWIKKEYISEYKTDYKKDATPIDIGSNNSVESSGKYKTSKGYTSDPDYEPTVDDNGEYHTIDGKRKQIQYQGSKEQQDQLNEMSKRGW